MFNPNQRARMLKKKLMRDNRYLLAKIGGAGQDPGERKVLTDYFRYKDYTDGSEWLKASEKEKWSDKFLGLGKDGFKKTEFQNPTYSAAYNLRRNLAEFSKVFTMQVAGCNYSCNYCFVPRKLNSADERYGRFFSAKEIVEEFLRIKKDSKEPMNVIRISGGECMIIPEIIIGVYNEIMKRSEDSYLWIDTNLSAIEIMEKEKNELEKVLSQKNVGVVGCFKGTTKEDFSLITGAEEKFYKNQFEATKFLIDLGTDFYAYIPAYIYEEKMAEEKLESFLFKLQKISRNLPLKLEVLKAEDFPAAKINFELAKKEGRTIPKTHQGYIFDLWHNKLLPKYYSEEELKKFCCEIRL
ncbi:MAG: radical SAM protein [Candidatus Pacebacteria bacterium]|nr:radical SAM protein [Candidatus Paceibacterota bacterium]